jgi:hypothetical protein
VIPPPHKTTTIEAKASTRMSSLAHSRTHTLSLAFVRSLPVVRTRCSGSDDIGRCACVRVVVRKIVIKEKNPGASPCCILHSCTLAEPPPPPRNSSSLLRAASAAPVVVVGTELQWCFVCLFCLLLTPPRARLHTKRNCVGTHTYTHTDKGRATLSIALRLPFIPRASLSLYIYVRISINNRAG